MLPVPAWLTEKSEDLPSEDETQPWFDAVCELWDDVGAYASAAALARATAEEWYSERVMRQRYLDYFNSLERRGPLFDKT